MKDKFVPDKILCLIIRLFLCLLLQQQQNDIASASSNRRADFTVQSSTVPATRLRGQIGCYSCFSWTETSNRNNNDSPKSERRRQKQQLLGNKTELAQIFRDAGMRVPVWADRCEETSPNGRPNFAGAELHVCGNSLERPGACVKLKGQHKGRWYVYRECWERMWSEKRSYHHEYTGKCYADKPVQQFVASQRNVLCFCEEDLCNGGGRRMEHKNWWWSMALATLMWHFLFTILTSAFSQF